jgi:predicted permease
VALDAFALILAMLLLGIAFQRFRVLPDNAAEVLNRFVLYVCLPAAVLRFAPQLELRPALLGVVAVPWLLLGATVLAVKALARPLRLRRDEQAVLVLTVALGNTSFLGYPLVRALIGEQALPYAVVYDQFGAFLILSTVGLWVLARGSAEEDTPPPGARAMLRRVFTFPPLLALLLGLTLMPAEPPVFLANGLRILSDALLPIVMVAIGLQIRFRLPHDELRPLAAGLLLKLALMPALGLGLAIALGMRGDMARAVVLEAAMPTMITASVLAVSHRLAPGLATGMVGFGIPLSLLTVPAWAWLLLRLFGEG